MRRCASFACMPEQNMEVPYGKTRKRQKRKKGGRRRYLALVPAGSGDDEAEDLEVSILKSVEENGEEFLEAIEDDAELEAVYSALMDLIYEDEDEPEA